MFYTGATLRWEVGLSRDWKGRGGLQELQSESLSLWNGRTEDDSDQQSAVLLTGREMQLPAELRRWQRREGLHRVSTGDLSL